MKITTQKDKKNGSHVFREEILELIGFVFQIC